MKLEAEAEAAEAMDERRSIFQTSRLGIEQLSEQVLLLTNNLELMRFSAYIILSKLGSNRQKGSEALMWTF